MDRPRPKAGGLVGEPGEASSLSGRLFPRRGVTSQVIGVVPAGEAISHTARRYGAAGLNCPTPEAVQRRLERGDKAIWG